jgi:hypothetical protein
MRSRLSMSALCHKRTFREPASDGDKNCGELRTSVRYPSIVPIKVLRKMPQTNDTMHIPASRGQIEEAVRTLMKTLPLHPDAPVLPGVTDHPGFKELLVADVSDAIEAKHPSIFTLSTTMQTLLAHCDYCPHRDEILQILEVGADEIKKGLA